MNPWAPLLPPALMGPERAPQWQAAAQAQALSRPDDAVQALLGQVLSFPAAEPAAAAATLLRAAGVLAVAQRAGQAPAAAPAALPPPAPADPRPALDDPRWQAALQRLLQEAPWRLVHEAAEALQQRGWRLPARLLPLALARAAREGLLRAPLAPLLGERGAWLAAQHPQWRAVLQAPAQPTPDHWAHGSIAERAAFLRHERGTDPAAARQRLLAELPQQGARERAELVATLAAGLSMADAPALLALLTDRSREVRQQAATLLLGLPDSDHGRYLAAQLGALLRSPGGPRRPHWLLEPPAAEDPAWKDHAIEPQRPRHEALGERAWWLYQLVRLVPPPWWCDRLQMPPAAVLQWGLKTDWADALLRGWRDALLAAAPLPAPPAAPAAWAPDWAQALLDAWAAQALGPDRSAVQALLPLARREAQWLRLLEGGGGRGPGDVTRLLQEVTSACGSGECLSEPFGRRLAEALRDDLLSHGAAGFGQFQRDLVLSASALLPLAALAPLRQMPQPQPGTPSQLELLAQLEHWVELRLVLPGLPAAPGSAAPMPAAPAAAGAVPGPTPAEAGPAAASWASAPAPAATSPTAPSPEAPPP